MKFTKGIILGSLLTAGAMMMYSEGIDTNKKKMIKRKTIRKKDENSYVKKSLVY